MGGVPCDGHAGPIKTCFQASEPVTVDSKMQKVVRTDGDLLKAWRMWKCWLSLLVIVLTGQTQRKGPAQGLCFCKVPAGNVTVASLVLSLSFFLAL